jgi:hypothetical protein
MWELEVAIRFLTGAAIGYIVAVIVAATIGWWWSTFKL